MLNAINSEPMKHVVKMNDWSEVLELAREHEWKPIEIKQLDAENTNMDQGSSENNYGNGWQRIEWEDAVNIKDTVNKALPNLSRTKRDSIELELDGLDDLVEYWPFDDCLVLIK